MRLSEQQLNNITTRIREDMSLMNTVNKRKFERKQFEDFVEQFVSLDNNDTIDLINTIYQQQYISLENACVENYDYILITGLGNLRTNQARQEILKIVANGGTTYKEDIQHIMNEYIRTKEANNKIVEVPIKLSFNEKSTTR